MKKLFVLPAAGIVLAALLCSCTPEAPSVKAISFAPASVTVAVGETAKVDAIVSPADALPLLAWSVDNPNVASFKKDGDYLHIVVTGVSAGTANITAETGSVKATLPVTVTPQPFPIQFTRTQLDTTIALKEELSYTFKYKCYDPFKVGMELLDNDGMAPQFTNSPGDGRLLLYDYKGRYQSVATCRVKIYDDISEQIIKITVREKK